MKEVTSVCDLCGGPVIPHVDAIYGGVDQPRHYKCHTDKHGVPDPFGLKKLDSIKIEIDNLRGKIAAVEESFAFGRNPSVIQHPRTGFLDLERGWDDDGIIGKS